MKKIQRTRQNRNFQFDGDYDEYIDDEGKADRYFAPKNLSIIENHDETLEYFIGLLGKVRLRSYFHVIFCDLSQIELLTIDAVMYLIAIIMNLRGDKTNKTQVGGNAPKRHTPQKLFRESGFYNYVVSKSARYIRPENGRIFQIKTGINVNNDVLDELRDFVMFSCGVKESRPIFMDIYRILGEMMSNTQEHAYNDGKYLNRWYIFVENSQSIIKFVFLDTGDGIPNTIRKKILEQLTAKDYDYIFSALKGDECRSETGEPHRGTGLPYMYAMCQQGKFVRFRLESGNGVFLYESGVTKVFSTNSNIAGTLFYWEMAKGSLREGLTA